MKHVTGLRCVICQKVYQPDEVLYVCPDHGNEGILEVEYDYGAIRAEIGDVLPDASGGMFAYRPFLPVAENVPASPLVVGATPLQAAPRLAEAASVAELWLKDDGRNPTASLKDRASAVAIMKAQELGAEIVTTASTGNAAAALAGLAASVGQKTVIFVPKSAPAAKIAQLLVYGATVLLVEGTYDDAFYLCLQATEKFGWYCRNTGYNPYMAEGKKTVTFELYAQLMQQRAADAAPITHLFVSVGDGCIISGVYKGVRDLVAAGFLPAGQPMPKIIGVQAAGSAYLYDAWANDEDVLTKPPIAANTVADSISAGLPRDRIKAITAVRQTNGAFITVTDEQILAAIPALAQGSGVFAEPASAATYAGFLKAAQTGLIGPDARVALILTGNGLKDVNSAMKSVGQAVTIPPEITAVQHIVNQMG
jgi:threonine synthase